MALKQELTTAQHNFLALGMLDNETATASFVLGFWLQIHRLGFSLTARIVGGLFQLIKMA